MVSRDITEGRGSATVGSGGVLELITLLLVHQKVMLVRMLEAEIILVLEGLAAAAGLVIILYLNS